MISPWHPVVVVIFCGGGVVLVWWCGGVVPAIPSLLPTFLPSSLLSGYLLSPPDSFLSDLFQLNQSMSVQVSLKQTVTFLQIKLKSEAEEKKVKYFNR